MNPLLKSPLRIIVILCLVSSVGRFVIDSYLPSLPAIANSLQLSSRSVEMTLTLYLLGFGLSQLAYGPLSDHFGRRKVLLTGLCIFLIGAIGCMLAKTSNMLMLSRVVAGLGAGSCGVLNRAIASDCFSGKAFSKAWSYTTTTLVLTLIFAPLIGGYVQQFFASWRANFFLTVVFVGIIMAIVFFTLPETRSTQKPSNLDLKTIGKNYLTVLASPTFLVATLFYTLSFAGLIAYFQVSPLLFIDDFHLSPSQYSLSSIGIAASYLLGGQFVRTHVNKMGVTRMLYLGIGILATGGVTMLMSCYLFASSWQAVLVSAMIYVLGTRIVIPNAMSLAVQPFKHTAGTTSAVIGSIQMLGAMVVSALLAHFTTQNATPLAAFLVIIGAASILLANINSKLVSIGYDGN